MRKRITDLSVARMREPGEVWDTLLPSFGVRVGARTKTWIVATRRPGSSHPVRLKIGEFPDLSVADARAKAREMMAGGAPAAPVLFKERIEPFLAHGRTRKGRPLRPASIRVYRGILYGTARPLHDKAVADIRRRDISGLLADVEANSGAPMAALTKATLGRFWTWLLETDQADASPVIGTPAYEVPKRSRVLSDAELKAIWAATEEPADFHLIVRLLLWTGCRRSEAGGVRWSDLVDGRWEIPGERTKNGQALVLPIARQMSEALGAWPHVADKDTLFGSRSTVGYNSWGDAKARLDAALKFNRAFVLHDLRRTCETRLAKLGVVKEIRSRILNHDVGNIDESYQHHDFMDEKRGALQLWADEIERIANSSP
jgi:integrase